MIRLAVWSGSNSSCSFRRSLNGFRPFTKPVQIYKPFGTRTLGRTATLPPNHCFLRAFSLCTRRTKFSTVAESIPPFLSLRWFATLGPRFPFAFGVGVATVKTAVADLLVQVTTGDGEIDWVRTSLFTIFGFAYLGVFQYGLYVTCFSRWFPNAPKFAAMTFREKLRFKPGLIDLAKQVGFDCIIHGPLIFFPIYYILKEAIQGKQNLFNATFGEYSTNALVKLKKNYWEDLINFWKIWIPGDILVMSLPLWLRLPANHGISFVYVCILSFMRGAPEELPEIEDQTVGAIE